MPQRFIQDAELNRTATLPAGANTTYTEDIDLGQGEKFEDMELLVQIPALTLTELPNGTTITAKAFHGDAATPTTELAVIGRVTGATASDPSEPAALRYRFPSTTKRYVRIGFTGVANVAAGSKKAKVSPVF